MTNVLNHHAPTTPVLLANEATLDLLLVQFRREFFGIPISSVREIARYRTPTPVPGAPPTLPGIVNQRGAILPVVDLQLVLGFDSEDPGSTTRLVIVQQQDVDMALLVPRVLDLVAVPEHTLESLPGALDPTRAALLRGVCRWENVPVALLDLDALIARLREEG